MARPARMKKSDVIALTLPIFWEKGYMATSIMDIETATGQGRSSLYHAFKDKDNLYVEALNAYVETHLQPLFMPFVNGEQDIEGLLQSVTKFALQTRHPQGCFLLRSIGERNVVTPAVYKAIKAAQTKRDQWLSDGLREHYNGLSLGNADIVRALMEAHIVFVLTMGQTKVDTVSAHDMTDSIMIPINDIVGRQHAARGAKSGRRR